MRTFIFISSLLLILSVTSCTDQQEDALSPLAPEAYGNSAGYQDECRSSLITIANAAVLYFHANGFYPADMEELGEPFSSLLCPECEENYLLETDQSNYTVSCPVSISMPHGSICNSVPSWAPEALQICHGNMRTIASQCIIFFAVNDRFPENLEELGMGDYVCPACDEQYTYYLTPDCFFVGCSLPEGLNHGNIDEGVASWSSEQDPRSACRANMRTIASQNVIFFACNDRYARTLEELEMGGVVCPECGDEYILLGTDTSYYLECGLSSDPNHGNIDNGVPSW